MHKVILKFNGYAIFKYLMVCLCVVNAIVFFLSARPVQDDYSLLADVSELGLFGYLELVWNTHGGNLTPMFINFLAASTAVNAFNFFSFSIFSLVTMAFVFLTILYFLNTFSLSEKYINSRLKVALCGGTILGFEGLFSPGLIGSYNFTSAAAVHLWPILLTFAAYFIVMSNSKLYLVILAVGFLAGNSNVAESLAILMLLSFLFFFPSRFDVTVPRTKLLIFFSGVFLGTLAIVTSPGFWFRATEKTSQGLPSSPIDIFERLIRSLSAFSAEVLTHPTFYIFLASGVMLAKSTDEFSEIRWRWNFIEVFFVFLFASLTIGATFAYPAWHQSLGLLFLLPVFSLLLGTRLARIIRKHHLMWIRIFQLLMVALLAISITRANILLWNSSREWHDRNVVNICSLREDPTASTSNPEIRYPPFSLGIEGSQSWPWIRDSYIRWLSNVPSAVTINCEKT